MTKVKICGLSRPEDIEAVNWLKPDYCGFIINYPKSIRNITLERLRELTGMLDPGIIPVGVFVDQPDDLPAALLNDGTIGAAQLHGSEDNAYIAALKEKTGGGTVWKAFRVRSEADVAEAQKCTADLVLLDAGRGSGHTFNWELLEGLEISYALAGGLDISNVDDALKTGAVLLDVSGGVETGGVKDPGKIKEFIDRVRLYRP